MFSVLYNVTLFLLALAAFPRFLYQRIAFGKYRRSFRSRFASAYPTIEKEGRELFWVHAVSVGETRAVTALAKMIKEHHPDSILVVSSVTETGHIEAKRSMPFADYHLYLPIDFSWNVRRVLKKIVPDVVIVTETDLWYHFLRVSRGQGAKIYVVNGKISERSASRLQKVPFFARRLYGLVDLFCVQAEVYRKRLLEIGVGSDRVVITGNIKFDASYPKLAPSELRKFRAEMGVRQGDPVLVVASTHEGEERELLFALKKVWDYIPDLRVLLAPRHPERFETVAALFKKEGVPFLRFSDPLEGPSDARLVLIDAMGQLRRCFQLADLAIVAGSFTSKVGGHNILEPLGYGVPVIFGPHMFAQPELVRLVREHDAGRQVSIEEVSSQLIELFENKSLRQQLGRHGMDLVANIQGATRRTAELLHIV